MVEKVGFKLVVSSEVNVNLFDIVVYFCGVWILFLLLCLGEENQVYYLVIGESDCMILKFVKFD